MFRNMFNIDQPCHTLIQIQCMTFCFQSFSPLILIYNNEYIYIYIYIIICDLCKFRNIGWQIALFRLINRHICLIIFYTFQLSCKLNEQIQYCLMSNCLYYVVLFYYIPFSNLITGSLYSERKLVTCYKAKLPAYAMTPA